MHIVNALTRAYPKNSIPKVDEQSQFCHQVEDLNTYLSQQTLLTNLVKSQLTT